MKSHTIYEVDYKGSISLAVQHSPLDAALTSTACFFRRLRRMHHAPMTGIAIPRAVTPRAHSRPWLRDTREPIRNSILCIPRIRFFMFIQPIRQGFWVTLSTVRATTATSCTKRQSRERFTIKYCNPRSKQVRLLVCYEEGRFKLNIEHFILKLQDWR